ncbi:ADP-ribosylation factor GTPase-activating protein 2 isoform X2 [Chrysoperla carnea]|uniref:ADP-ribosylation factor GTPase-activating protein 2 isoform X2 n=1 Tax=Chrysoperla carnea TaxID=189513 RepID=UPI001D0707E9|nr:ADP-ribosylation factor GTPase-activating protein 2 isoform X2 [Chrysoperla carnea]
MADGPSKKDIEALFTRLRSIAANKVCFDCSAKNPTWSSVTYGVFICIDCSAVHRGLGVHLTFVRSTQLDTNWTWQQLRQMQLGGNANATQFFSQHNCVTTDAQQKYNSRAAQLYREKLSNLAQQAMLKHGKENIRETIKLEFTGEPSVNLSDVKSPTERKSTIGVRKVQNRKPGMGAKKGFGATKVKTNFDEIEREAELADVNRRKAAADAEQATIQLAEQKEKQLASMRLAYQDLSLQQKKQQDKLKQVDPKKAEQIERLGMGFGSRSGISHSALTDMQTIEQENLEKGPSALSKLMNRDTEGFFDDYNCSSSFSMNRNSFTSNGNKYGGNTTNTIEIENLLQSSKEIDSLFENCSIIDWPESSSPPKEKPRVVERTAPKLSSHSSDKTSPSDDAAQKKFGSAKAISSDQFFNSGSDDYERKANLNRFQGSSSISSADYFGDSKGTASNNSMANNFQAPDLDDVKESVRQGVTKVAGKLSSLANGVMSSIQDRYGY